MTRQALSQLSVGHEANASNTIPLPAPQIPRNATAAAIAASARTETGAVEADAVGVVGTAPPGADVVVVAAEVAPVSYTHLTLPTSDLV